MLHLKRTIISQDDMRKWTKVRFTEGPHIGHVAMETSTTGETWSHYNVKCECGAEYGSNMSGGWGSKGKTTTYGDESLA